MTIVDCIRMCAASIFLLHGTVFGISGTKKSASQLPIHVVYVNHVEIESIIDYVPPLIEGRAYSTSTTRYNFTRGQLEWEMAQAEAAGASVSFHMSGAYAIKALVDGDSLEWNTHVQAGHTIGVHAHAFVMGANPFIWISKTNATQQEKEKHWLDNNSLVAALVGSSSLWISESHYDCPHCWTDLGYSLRTTEAIARLPLGKHIVWLAERAQDSVVSYPHFPQIGEVGFHGPVGQREFFDLRIPQLKKEFLLLYLEWLERERLNLPSQVWVWGWVNHGGASTQFHAADIVEMLTWMNQEFIGKMSAGGNVIAQFVNDHQVKQIYETYEQGGQPLPSPLDSINDQFPYLTYALSDCGVIENLTGDLNMGGLRLFGMEKDSPLDSLPPLDTVYLLFRENDGQDTIDIGPVLNGLGEPASLLTLVDVVTGDSTDTPTGSFIVGSIPVVFWPSSPIRCGDANGDVTVDISDVVYLIGYIFSGGPAPTPLPAGDVNCDGVVDISDAVYLITYIFSGGPQPCAACK